MSFQGNVLYSPYGAAELKATYQRNMALGTLTAVALTLMIMGAFWVVGVFTDGSVAEPQPLHRITQIIDLPLPPPITKPRPRVAAEMADVAPPPVGIPVPIPDEEMIDNSVVIASKKQLAEWNGRIPDTIIEEGGGFVVDIQDEEIWEPEIVEFCEQPPEMIHYVLPEYPRLMEKVGIEGSVWVKALVDTDGSVKQAEVAKTSTNTAFDEAAVKAAYKNKYTPGIQNGRPVLVWVTYKVEFVLER